MAPSNTIQTEVCILGGGPAGMVLGNLLHEQNIPCVVIERLDPESIKAEGRAGIIEWTTVAALEKHGLAKQMLSDHRTQGQCEFRTPEWTFMLDYASLNGGRVHTVYPQTDLVYDLSKIFEQRGGQALYHVEGLSLEQSEDDVTVHCKQLDDGGQLTIKASFVVGCDGGRGLSKRTLPEGAVQVFHQEHDIHWLAVLAHVKPYFPYTIYAMHPDGMAAFLMRNDAVCRYYLQVDKNDVAENWDEQRIWDTLEHRFFMTESLNRGSIYKKNTMSLRSLVTEPMRHQRLFLAGDAAHLIPPTGAKGMNLAIHDVLVLGELLIELYQGNIKEEDLDLYSQRRLPLIWKAQNFSLQLMHMIHRHPSDFDQQLWLSNVKQLETSPAFAASFSIDYVGIL